MGLTPACEEGLPANLLGALAWARTSPFCVCVYVRVVGSVTPLPRAPSPKARWVRSWVLGPVLPGRLLRDLICKREITTVPTSWHHSKRDSDDSQSASAMIGSTVFWS